MPPPLTAIPTVCVPLTVAPSGGLVKEAVKTGACTVIVRVGGLGSLSPRLSVTVSETMYVPGVENVTAPGVAALLVADEPPGKTHERVATLPSASVPSPLNVTDCPALIVTSVVGFRIVPWGGRLIGLNASCTNFAREGTPFLS